MQFSLQKTGPKPDIWNLVDGSLETATNQLNEYDQLMFNDPYGKHNNKYLALAKANLKLAKLRGKDIRELKQRVDSYKS